MKFRNYIFGRITDPYHSVEKIKNIFEFRKSTKSVKYFDLIKKAANSYKIKIEENSDTIKNDVHRFLRNNYICFENNVEEELIFINNYLYFEIITDKYIMICRKKIKRKFKTNLNYFYQNNKSINDLKKEKFISNLNSEIVGIFPSNFSIKFLKIYKNSLFTFIVEQSDYPLNLCYSYKGTIHVNDRNLYNIDSNYVLKDICNECVVKNNFKKKKNIYYNKNLYEIINKNNLRKYRILTKNNKNHNQIREENSFGNNTLDKCRQYENNINKNCTNDKNYEEYEKNKEGLYRLVLPMIQYCNYLTHGIQNIEYIKLKNKVNFLSSEMNEKYRCSKLFLNCSFFDKILIYDEKNDEYFLNLYKSKDQKIIFLLSGSHLHNKLFIINVEGNNRKSMNCFINLVQMNSKILQGKCFLEHFFNHIIFILKGKNNTTHIFFMRCKDLNHLIQNKKNKTQKFEKIKKLKKIGNLSKDGLYIHEEKSKMCRFPLYGLYSEKIEINIDKYIKKLITLDDCIIQDFDMTRYGLALCLYRNFLKPFVFIIYLFRKNVKFYDATSCSKDVIVQKRGKLSSNNGNSNRKEILVHKIKMIHLPIEKGSIQSGINNNFYNNFLNIHVSNTFVNTIRLVINLRQCIIALPKNIHKNRGQYNSYFKAKNNSFMYDIELEQIFQKNKNFAIKDIFINNSDSEQIPITLIYKIKDNDKIFFCENKKKEKYTTFFERINENVSNQEKHYHNKFNKDGKKKLYLFSHFPKEKFDLPNICKNDLPLFINPSKTIINAYPFYGELNICNYTDEYYFYLLNNFVIAYFHLTGSGGFNKKVDKFKGKTYLKIKALEDLTNCINFLKYKNISNTNNMYMYFYSNSGLLGGYILNNVKKIVKNIIFVNPMLDLFNNLTDINNHFVNSELLEFGKFKVNEFLLKKNKNIDIDNLTVLHTKKICPYPSQTIKSNNEIRQLKNDDKKMEKKMERGKLKCINKLYTLNRFPYFYYNNTKSIRKKIKYNINKNKRRYTKYYWKNNLFKNNLVMLYYICPYNNITAKYSEIYTNKENIKVEFKKYMDIKNDENLKNNIILHINNYDIICPNYNSIKFFLKYINYKNIEIKQYYYVNIKNYKYIQNGTKINFLNYSNYEYLQEQNNRNKDKDVCDIYLYNNKTNNFYVSISKNGGHTGFNDYISHTKKLMEKIYFIIFSNWK
ncbi:conserved Plasmodium protein, unknown function [Plasmodium berghei]|uniref:Peptidase n=2 Tax=Plasmodium berghei TaxID=5821 RepID=A0A509AQI3_PLABA|nr:conserved Plasmodium protein, unknown function [Plasmodium berghei ANKA]CXI77981.1 conserved Plasmodium protein, unknown function [Plasmodium berghei]SCM25122.1 conserved Plasmodium protein, unknown function [Plasmodium berghei]SCN27269.1 conserved Plasmodium protein, unknown function [Plasmodium berghei]SCO61871.1 conserved Plasmodium protein, unknown function [Plasmodium berghei]SCO63695.1 conserved Plasmodium protein, unknown function [Plasmodium berghei]|eukprot:XP_034422905.1 conserved Plasmodium protein, unknown function [Plasmodium berghei ANKA]